MAVQVVTWEDLQDFRIQLINDIKEILSHSKQSGNESIEFLKTSQVRKLLNCSNGKIQSLRITGELTSKKVGGTLYYKQEDVKRILGQDNS
jgi:hypothetical protein